MGNLEEIAEAAVPANQAAQLRELRKANEHLKEIRKWICFLGWIVLLYLIGSVLFVVMGLIRSATAG